MARVLRAFVIVSLLLSVAGLVLGVRLFRRREILRGRTERLETGLQTIAQTIASPREPHVRAMEVAVDPAKLQTLDEMEGQIRIVAGAAEERRGQHFQEGEDHLATKTKLTQAELDLATTRQQLADAGRQLAQAREEIVGKEAEIAARQGRIDGLTTEKGDLETDAGRLRGQAEELRKEKEVLAARFAWLDDLINRRNNDPLPTTVRPGLAGEIVTVSPRWDFVVLNIGSQDTLVPSAEMLVHRGEQWIGKVRVRHVTETRSVADILREWQTQPPEAGDRVLF